MERTCIICLEKKTSDLFNEEHLFPAAIGGGIILKNVCRNCNENLGRNIDSPLLRNDLILHYRNVFGVARNQHGDKRKIGTPFRHPVKDADGNLHRVVYREGKLGTERIVQHKITEKDDGILVELTAPIEMMDQLDELAKKILKRNGLPTNYILLDKVINSPKGPIDVQLNMEHNSFIFGCVKIAYEAVASFFPNYINDPIAADLRNLLNSQTLLPQTKKRLNKGMRLNKVFTEKLLKIKGLMLFHHTVIIECLQDVGLVCSVNLFGNPYTVIMSDKFIPLAHGHSLFLYNNSIDQNYGHNIYYEVPNVKLSIDTLDLPESERETLRIKGDNHMKKTDGKVSIFDQSKQKVFDDPISLGINILEQRGQDLFWLHKNPSFDLNDDQFYIQTETGSYARVISIVPERNVILAPLS